MNPRWLVMGAEDDKGEVVVWASRYVSQVSMEVTPRFNEIGTRGDGVQMYRYESPPTTTVHITAMDPITQMGRGAQLFDEYVEALLGRDPFAPDPGVVTMTRSDDGLTWAPEPDPVLTSPWPDLDSLPTLEGLPSF